MLDAFDSEPHLYEVPLTCENEHLHRVPNGMFLLAAFPCVTFTDDVIVMKWWSKVSTELVFLPREHSCASTVLGVEILSVTGVECDKTK